MGRPRVVVLDPAAELREHRLGIAQVGPTEVIPLEGPTKASAGPLLP